MTRSLVSFISPMSRKAALFLLAMSPAVAFPAELATPEPIGAPAMKAYRQIMPDGRIVYSDKLVEGARVDETITVDPPTKGNIWSSETGTPPKIAPQTMQTPVNRVSSIPEPGKRKTPEDADADVIRAEMLLDDAKKRRERGVEPLPGERTGNANGSSRLNDAYKARQKSLAQAVQAAEDALRKSIAQRDALRNTSNAGNTR